VGIAWLAIAPIAANIAAPATTAAAKNRLRPSRSRHCAGHRPGR
jgi:hypothetical protein